MFYNDLATQTNLALCEEVIPMKRVRCHKATHHFSRKFKKSLMFTGLQGTPEQREVIYKWKKRVTLLTLNFPR